jgi:hypothetical protein
MLLLQSAAYDDTGRPLAGRHLRWYLGRRLIGHGDQVAVRDLKPGIAVIRLVATDAHGRSAQASARVRVRPAAARYLFVFAPLRVSAQARSIRIRIAASGPATFTIAGKRYAVGPRVRTITVRIPRGRSLLILRCSLRSPGGVIRGTYVAFRWGR